MRNLILSIVTAIAVVLLPAGPARAAGLLAPTDQTLPPLRITDHLVDAKIRDGVAITTVTQIFHNDTDRRLEATYVFPLPENADLTDFQMSFNGKMVKGTVLPAEEAARVYESIVRQTKDPGLIEFIGRRLLQMRVFPIEPKSDTTIEVRYQQVCRPISGMQGFHYPLRTRKTAGQAYGTVRFAVDLETSTPLKSIWSPTHAVEIVRAGDERSAKIAYEASKGSLEDDFLLLYATDSSDLGLATVAYKPDETRPGHFVLMLTPKQLWPEESYQPQDVVFVMDTSGSMAGDKLEQAKAAMKFCIDRLDERDRFSVVRFSTGFDVLFDDVQPAGADNKKKAREWVQGFSAAGGTNITDTLLHVFGMKPPLPVTGVGRSFVTVFLTDGRGNREAAEIINTLADDAPKELGGFRIFPFGVGHDVNTKTLDRLAERYTGRVTYVQPGENLELVLGDFFSVISRPVLTNLRIALPAIGATERFPATLGDLYHGQQIVIAGRYADEATGAVKLTAQRGGETIEYVWPKVAFRSVDGADYVPSVWAGRKIAYLIDQIRTHGESSEMVEEILALSQEYGIQTPYTSWLVNPEGAPQPVITRRGRRRLGELQDGSPASTASAPAQLERLRRVAPGADRSGGSGGGFGGGSLFGDPGDAPAAAGEAYFFGDEFDDLDLVLAAKMVTAEAGREANLIARKNAELRDLRSRDEDRLDRDMLPYVKVGDRWYNRLGSFLVDEMFGETTRLVAVKFASPAYFELARSRPDLRAALAASRSIVVMVGDDTAALVSDRVGTEELSDEEREQLGLKGD